VTTATLLTLLSIVGICTDRWEAQLVTLSELGLSAGRFAGLHRLLFFSVEFRAFFALFRISR
jgi:hypothetical protein